MIRRRALTLTSLRHQFDSYRNSNTNPTIRPFSTSPISYYTRFFSSSSQTQRRLNVRCLASHNSFPSNSISSNDLKNGISGVRSMSTRTMNGSTNRPPNETILLEGCDMEHWLVVVEPPDPNLTRDDIIDSYIKTLAQVLGSEEKARMKIYSVSTKHYFAFGCIVPEELSSKIKELPKVRWVLPDSYIDVRNKDYGGEPFINGQAVPYDPKYHELWVRNYNDSLRKDSNKRDRTRTGDRPRNNRRRDNITNQEMQHPPPPPPTQTSNPNTLATNVPNQNFTPTPNYQNQAPSMPTLAPNSGMPSPMQNHGVRRVDMPPQAPTNSFQNRNMPPTSGFQNRGMPPQVPNTSFQNRSMPPPMPRQNYQNVQQPMQNQDFPGRDVPPPPMVSGDVRNRNMPPPTQNWNYQSRNNPPPMQNHNFLDRDMSTPLQNHASQSRSMPEAVQNREYPNRGTHSLVQNQEYPKPSPMQNQNFYNRVAPLSIENHDLQDRDKPPPVESRNFSHMGVVRNGQYTRNDQSIDHQQWGTSDSMNMGNSPNRDHQSLHGDYEAVANRNF